jgi:hypothetical protein
MLSMEPFSWSNTRGVDVDEGIYQQGRLELDAFPDFDAEQWRGLVDETVIDGKIKEMEFRWIGGEPYYLANYSLNNGFNMSKRDRLHQPYAIIGQLESSNMLIDADNFQVSEGFDVDTLVATLDEGVTDASVTDFSLLTDYDDYYYSRNNQLPLPVLRIKFDDPEESWIYVDPKKSELLSLIHRYSRVERWFYSGLHSLDFAFWYHKRPLWDLGVIILLAGGLAVSCIGLYFGLHRLKKDLLFLLRKLTRTGKSQEVPSVSH